MDIDLCMLVNGRSIEIGEAMRRQAERNGDATAVARIASLIAATNKWKSAGIGPRLRAPTSQAVLVSRSTLEVPPPVSGPIGIPAIWIAEAPKIRESSGLARDLCEAHERTVEPRSDLTECQKNARRRIVLEAWYAEQARAAEGEAQ